MTRSDSAPLLTAAELAEHLFQDIFKLIPSDHPLGELLEKYHIASYSDSVGWGLNPLGEQLLEDLAQHYLNRMRRPAKQPLNTFERLIEHIEAHYPEHMSDPEKRRLLYAHADDIMQHGGDMPVVYHHMIADSFLCALWEIYPDKSAIEESVPDSS